jgi:hypothetical protein
VQGTAKPRISSLTVKDVPHVSHWTVTAIPAAPLPWCGGVMNLL